MQPSNPYRAEAEDLRARMQATTCPKERKQLREKAEHYEREARRFDQQKGGSDVERRAT
jgi:hypothetical protein